LLLVRNSSVTTASIFEHVPGPLWGVPLPAGSPRMLINQQVDDAAWSSDGKFMAFCQGHDLFLASGDGTKPHKIATLTDYPIVPRFSPDSTRLRFSTWDPDRTILSLWGMSLDGASPRPLLPTFHQNPGECCGRWTPDGRYFIFEVHRNNRSDI